MTQANDMIPTGMTVDVQSGPDGKPWVVLMFTCGTVTAAMALPPDVSDEYAARLPDEMRKASAKARQMASPLVRASASAIHRINKGASS